MASNLKVGITHAYQPYREVDPVAPYPRVDPQQPRDERQRRRAYKNQQDDRARRRFTAMRRLIDDLKVNFTVSRIDYMTAEQELVSLAREIVSKSLADELRRLNLSSENIEDVLYQIQQKFVPADLKTGKKLTEENNRLPLFVPGFSELNLFLEGIRIWLNGNCTGVLSAIRNDGRFFDEGRDFLVDIRNNPSLSVPLSVIMDLFVRVAVCEIDEAGRKAILYQRKDRSLALYADKQISLSI